MNLTPRILVLVTGAALTLSTGCMTKNSVRKETQPLIDKSNELDALTAKNTNAIKDVDARAQTGIQGVNEKATVADQKASDARRVADQAQVSANQAASGVDGLGNRVANLDNYREVVESSVHFAFDKADLTPKAKDALDQLIADVPNTKGYIIVVEGDTDAVGSATYNYQLSERRAEAVVQYLSAKNIPPRKIFVIGLGKDKSVESNGTSAGRAKNRRVDVRLMTNVAGQENPSSAQNTAPPSSQ